MVGFDQIACDQISESACLQVNEKQIFVDLLRKRWQLPPELLLYLSYRINPYGGLPHVDKINYAVLIFIAN